MVTLRASLLCCLGVVPAAFGADLPTGAWQSPPSVTFTNPALAGSEFFLSIDVAADGTFRGSWGQYTCTNFPGAYGISTISCSRSDGGAAQGKLDAGRSGSIDLTGLGRSTFTWSASSAEELVFELPKQWQDKETPVLYRSRLKRGKQKAPAAGAPSAKASEPVPSAAALYREFKKDPDGASKRHAGKTLVLEGLRGNLIPMSDGGAAIHVPDGTQPRALVLVFNELAAVKELPVGALFRFQCTVEHFDYQYVYLTGCVLPR
ncbi:MAG: hypothetical protein IT380_22610 [Myxococcales bacterium]|nr:hypothetical protein [Myxococcales bacterium]